MLIFPAMLRSFNVGEPVRCGGSLRCSNWRCVVAERNAPSTISGALAYGITHPTTNLYFFIYIEFFSPTYLWQAYQEEEDEQ